MGKIQSLGKWWHQDHMTWIAEVEQWQHESDRLVALLYQLECALPEHTAILNNHVESIQRHEGYLQQYENGMMRFDSLQEQEKYHFSLSQLHEKVRQEHESLKLSYSKEMERFKLLLTKLLKQCE